MNEISAYEYLHSKHHTGHANADAIRELSEFLDNYPNSKYTAEIRGLHDKFVYQFKAIRQEVTQLEIMKLRAAIQEYELATRGSPPTTAEGLKALVNKPTGENAPRAWRQILKEVPKDQWGNEFQYRLPGKGGRAFDVFSAGPDGQINTDDDICGSD